MAQGPMVARFRSSIRPVNRIKHVQDFQTAVPLNTKITQVIATAVNFPDNTVTNEVAHGSTVNGFFCTVEAVCDDTSTTATPNLYLIFYKNPGDNLTFPNGNAVGADDNKKYVFHQEMVMLNPTDGGNNLGDFCI